MRPTIPEGVAAAVAAIVIVIAAVTVGTRGPAATSSNAAAPPTASAPPAVQGSSPAATAAPQSRSPQSSARAPARVAPKAGGPVPPEPGHYEYNETDSNGSRVSTLDITSHGAGRYTENQDTGSAVDEVVWRPTGKIELATTFSFATGSVRCDWTPDFVEYKFPLRVGLSWSVHTSCHPNASSYITLSGTSRVTGHQATAAAGQPVDTWIFVTDATITFKGTGGSFSEAIRDEDHFAPAYGITVREIATTTDTDSTGQKTHDRSVRDITSLKPTEQV